MLAAGFAERRAILARAADALRASARRILDGKWRAFAALRLSGAVLNRLSVEGEKEAARLWSRLVAAGRRALRPERARFEAAAKLLETLSYENILARGFALIRADSGALIRTAGETASGERVTIRFVDGERGAVIDGAAGGGKAPGGAGRKPAARAVQKSLFD
jgi:exodeoxyribonuclease VII large subunit